jgi:acyl-CoA synthetase (AMP-forming)/AMP-acid ligase II
MLRPVDPPAALRTAHDAFAAAVARVPDNDFLCIPARAGRDYCPEGVTFSYAAMAERVANARARFAASGYGHGHRVAVLLGNRPEHFDQFLAANALGICIVPVSPDYTAREIAHLLGDSCVDLVITTQARRAEIEAAAALCSSRPPIHDIEALPDRFPAPERARLATAPHRETIAGLLYTSGTTGLPKGCLVSNEYFLTCGQWYISRGGRMAIAENEERLFNPFPVFHLNAGVLSLTAMALTGGCLISADRFHPSSWWRDLVDTRATIMHYMGVIPAMLLSLPPAPEERAHSLKFGMGAGVAPTIHDVFEERFGFPLIEVWAMTETGRLMTDHQEPRAIDRRARASSRAISTTTR